MSDIFEADDLTEDDGVFGANAETEAARASVMVAVSFIVGCGYNCEKI
jgi:hypothetical protein